MKIERILNNNYLGKAIFCSLLAVFLAAVANLPVSALTYQNDANILFTFNPAISLSISGDLSINNLQPNSASDSNIITVTAGSNTPTGYTLYTNVGDSTNNYTDLRLSSSDTTNTFSTLATGVSNLNGIGDSKWGYSYCNKTSNASACNTTSNWVYGSAGGTSIGYGGMPLYNDASHNNDIVLVNTNNPDSTTLDFKIGAKASSTQVAGTYSNVINFINVPKVVTTNYTLSYLDQSGTTTSGTLPAATTGTTSDGTFNITTSRPTNTNADYVFKGWCTADNQSDVTTCPSGGAIIYPGNLYVIASTSATWTGNVYTVWNSNYEPTQSSCPSSPMLSTVVSGINYMQDINSGNSATVLSALTAGDTYQIKDNRDNETYCVGKLADNKLWLLDNLALDLVAHKNDLTSTNTNASDEILAYLKNGGGADANQYANAGVAYWTSSYSYTAPLIAIKNASNTDWNPNTVPSDATSQSGQYKIGVYYNFCAASAGSYCYDDTFSAPSDSQNGVRNIDADICPKGWRMPTGGTSGEYSALANAIYGSTGYTSDSTAYANYSSALRLPRSGYFYNGSARSQGSSGNFWSSTRIVSGNMRSLNLGTSSVDPNNNNNRGNGNSVRCVLGS